jgi:hypothetical protein
MEAELRNQALLIGNGLNDVTNHYKWKDLLDDLTNFVEITQPKRNHSKPFPLFYEEIYLSNLRKNKYSEFKLKSLIGNKLRTFKPNEIHNRIKDLGFSEIMTTNYDYVIEEALGFDNYENQGVVKERTYSLFRSIKKEMVRVWHIHGELGLPNSILLGYEQYSGQLQHIRNYVVSGTKEDYKNFQSRALISMIKDGTIDENSWLGLFFRQNIHIVGLSLDYTESDLWWLITFRARMKLEGRLEIKNAITYYYPKVYEADNVEKLELFNANDIELKPIEFEHNLDYYNRVFDIIGEK